MSEPPVNKDMNALYPAFRAGLEAWLAEVAVKVPHVAMRTSETLRTLERQEWLYAQGREAPYLDAPEVTWTMESRHRWGLAADLVMIRRATGEAIWTPSSWAWVYKQTVPERFGIRNIIPKEYVHVEYWWADEAIKDAAALGLVEQ